MFVQAFIYSGGVNLYIWMSFVYSIYAFRCSNQAHEADILYASVLEHLDSGYGASAGGQHRIDDNEASVFNIWQLAVVFYRL